MAKLPEAIIETVLNLQRQLLERIDDATATEFAIEQPFGETDETIDYFAQLQNAKERADSYVSLHFTCPMSQISHLPIAA
jgi:hypothetical protein